MTYMRRIVKKNSQQLASAIIVIGLFWVGACKGPDQARADNVRIKEAHARALIAGTELWHASIWSGLDSANAGERAREHFSRAIQECERALEIDPSVNICRSSMGASHWGLGNIYEAERSYAAMLEWARTDLEIDYYPSLVASAWGYIELLELRDAPYEGASLLEDLARVMRFDPELASAAIYLMAQADLARAEEFAKESRSMSGYSRKFEFRFCEGVASGGRIISAVACFERLLEHPDFGDNDGADVVAKINLLRGGGEPAQLMTQPAVERGSPPLQK